MIEPTGKERPECYIEPRSVTIGKDYDTGKIYVLGEWPERMAVSTELLGATLEGIEVDGDRLTFACENGTAQYAKDGEDRFGDWTCRLIECTYEHQRWPLEQ